MTSPDRSTRFDAYYYAHCCGTPYQRNEEWLRFFGLVADRIVSDIRPQVVLDAGCALGFLVETLRARGVEAWGVDISDYAIRNVYEPIRPFCRIGSITEAFPRRYDLIVSIEVLEHMPQADSEQAIANFCRHTDDVLFSSTPFDYREATHFNVQPPETWAEAFARHSFYRDVDFDAGFITPWAVRFRRRGDPPARLVRDYERKFWLLWKENTDLRKLSVELHEQLAAQYETSQTLQRDLTERDLAVQTLSAQVTGREEALQDARPELETMLASWSWRLIKKLQRIARALTLRFCQGGELLDRLLRRK
jgi:SAM-dependent methyltransferase